MIRSQAGLHPEGNVMRIHIAAFVRITALAVSLLLVCIASGDASAQQSRPPSVLLIVTDDQGYGDVGFHGNTMLKTPSLDQLARQSVRLTNFHVDPTCAESR